MDNYNRNVIITGFSMVLFSITIAIISQASIALVVGGLGVALVMIGCFIKENDNEK